MQNGGADVSAYHFAEYVLGNTLLVDKSAADLMAYLISVRMNLNEKDSAQEAYLHFRRVARVTPLAKLPDIRQ